MEDDYVCLQQTMLITRRLNPCVSCMYHKFSWRISRGMEWII